MYKYFDPFNIQAVITWNINLFSLRVACWAVDLLLIMQLQSQKNNNQLQEFEWSRDKYLSAVYHMLGIYVFNTSVLFCALATTP